MYLGIDLGTSAVKVVLVDERQSILAQESASLEVQRPHPLWSEQDPDSWWEATATAIGRIAQTRSTELTGLRGIGLAGQMHGATLLDAADRVLRPAILWNDGRSAEQCVELERRVPDSRKLTGNLAMPGFTAPKLLWLARHEPEVFASVACVLLPKDYLRLRLSGDRATDLSDAAGTLWLDVGRRSWSDEMISATGLSCTAMPELFEGSQPTGVLSDGLADEWGIPHDVPIAAGAGDQAGGAAGVGVVRPGSALLSLGTSGVYFVSNERYAPNPDGAVHTFCHCVPQTWHQMSVILSAASCLSWVCELTGAADEAAMLAEIEAEPGGAGTEIFLPYLTGERTPHNDPHARGVFFGLDASTTRARLGRAVLEGVAFALADGQRVLLEAGARIDSVAVIGGGARSAYWGQMLASVLGRTLDYPRDAEVGPAFGAARLARLAVTREDPLQVCGSPPLERSVDPEPGQQALYAEGYLRYRELYSDLRQAFVRSGSRI
ncbi:MAG: xylulokinase [bacterium]|nr:xylulokinase [bacterium]